MKAANGKEIRLYYPNGTTMSSIEEFIDFYSNCYYLYNNKEVEDVIDSILENGINSELELFKVLSWKLGRIDMKKSKKDAFVYYEKTTEEDKQLRLFHKKDVMNNSDIEELYHKIIKHTEKCDSDEEAQNFLNELKKLTDEKGWKQYFYPVYMITLLYFVSKGEYPIIDSFSYVALEAIYDKRAFGIRKSYPGLVNRDTPEFEKTITEGNYADYRIKLKEIFGEKAKSRKVDQALWAYGKLFKKS